jgi:hypothetical protein
MKGNNMFWRKRTPEALARARESDFRTVVIILLAIIAVNSCTIDDKLGKITSAAYVRPAIEFHN